MSNEYYTLKGKSKHLRGTFIILSVFLIDSLLGSVSMFQGQAETMDEWFEQIRWFCMFRSIFTWIPYLLLLYIARNGIKLDWMDEAILINCLLMSIVDTTDYITNANWRGVWMDWIVFGIFTSLLIALKLHKTAKRLN